MTLSRILLSTALAGTIVVTANADAVPKEIKARYQGVKKALQSMDMKSFADFFADGFTTGTKGAKPQTKAEFLKAVTPMFANATKVTCAEKLISSSKHGDVVDVKFDFSMTIHNKDKSKLLIKEIGVDSWKKVGGVWKMVKTVDDKFDVKPSK